MSNLTSKEDAFARAMAEGKGASDAYRASRDCSRMRTATINANAKKLARKPAIKARIEELRRESRESRESPATADQARGSVSTAGQAEEQKPGGRPTVYSEEIAEKICERLSAGEPLRSICRDDGMPAESTVRAWALDPQHPVSARYARAREIGAWTLADEILEISDAVDDDWTEKETKSGEKVMVVNREVIDRARLRIQTRQWLLGKMLPRSFGDKVELTAPNGMPPERVPRGLTDIEMARWIAWTLSEGAREMEKAKDEGQELDLPTSPRSPWDSGRQKQ